MSEPLSQQIGAFRRSFGRDVDDGVGLTGEAVEKLDALFASFQAQARVLEGGGPPDFGTFDELRAAVSGEAKALGLMATRLEATTARQRSAEIVAFPARGGGA